MAQVTMRELLEAGVHFGHQTNRWNPKMRPYIYTARNGVHIINLQKTLRLYRDAERFIQTLASRGESVLFVATKRQAQGVVQEEAVRCKMHYITSRWLGGMLTNFKTVRQSIDKISEIDKMLSEGSVEKLPKKEVLRLEKSREKLMKNLGGIREMTRLPGAMFVVDPKKEHIAVSEANRLGIPVIAMVDTNCDPDVINYVIPANDDAIRGIQLVASGLADAVLAGMQEHKEHLVRGFDKEPALTSVSAMSDSGYAQTGMASPGAEVVRKPRRGADTAQSNVD